jgi:hypothetical protein
MRAVVLAFLGLAALGAVSVQAAPIVVPAKLIAVELEAAPWIELVPQCCGWGWHGGGCRDPERRNLRRLLWFLVIVRN